MVAELARRCSRIVGHSSLSWGTASSAANGIPGRPLIRRRRFRLDGLAPSALARRSFASRQGEDGEEDGDEDARLKKILENIKVQMQKRSMQDGTPKLALAFKCSFAGECSNPDDRQTVKLISKKSYEEGVVLVKCSCERLHLIADNLGWFGEERNVEEILANKSEQVERLRAKDLFDDNDDMAELK